MPKGVFIRTEEFKKKISEALKGKLKSEETRRKMSERQKGEKNHFFGKKLSEEHKRKMSEAHKGKKHFEETKQKIGETSKGRNPMLGKHHSEETKRKISEAYKGDKNPQWKGGLSFEPYTVDWTDDLRESIRKRDNHICQLCGIHKDELIGRCKKLDTHHIDYNKDNCNPDNLITLCRKCHIRTNYNRKYWTQYFKSESI